jgi:hypothetical protein
MSAERKGWQDPEGILRRKLLQAGVDATIGAEMIVDKAA